MIELIKDTISDTLPVIPFLFIIYLLLEYLQNKARHLKISPSKLNRYGPAVGGIAGCIPQCGFSAAAASLYNNNAIKAGTLIAVFLATSDEAIPVLLSSSAGLPLVLPLILIKLAAGIGTGYILNYTVFRREPPGNDALDTKFTSCGTNEHHAHKNAVIRHAAFHTLKIFAYVFAALLAVNVLVFLLGEERFAAVLLSGSVFQPFITALAGFIPGCSVSVLITRLLVSGELSLGAGIAGLCTGAGFGYIVLFKGKRTGDALKIMSLTYVSAVLTGMTVNVIF